MAALNANSISNPGQNLSAGDRDALFMKMFSGEVLTAFARSSVMMSRHMVRTIPHGKSASFPVMGRTNAQYLAPGNSLDDQRKKMENTERVIVIDGLLTADALITDIDDAMNHYDVRTEYSRQLGEALAQAADCAIINELANEAEKSDSKFKENIPTNNTLGNPGTGSAFEYVTGADEAQTVAFGQKIYEGLLAAQAKFTKNWVPASERYCLLSPDGYTALLRFLSPDNAHWQTIINPQTGTLSNVAGFEIIQTPNLDNPGVGGKHQLKSSIKTAVLQGIVWHRSAVGTVKLKDLSMERARRAEYQADQIIAKYSMGHGGLRPEAVGIFVKTAQA